MPRTNSCGVTEVASIRSDLDTYGKEHNRIFGEKPSPFCDKCDKRHSFCECQTNEEIVERVEKALKNKDSLQQVGMKELDMSDYVETKVDTPELVIEFNNVAIPEGYSGEDTIKRLKEEISKTDPEFVRRISEY